METMRPPPISNVTLSGCESMSYSSLSNDGLLRLERKRENRNSVLKNEAIPCDTKKRFPTGWSVGNGSYLHKALFSESQFFDKLAIAGEVGLAQIGEQALSFTNQLHEAAVSGEIFFVGLQVFRDTVDPFRQQSNLSLDRSGVGGLSTELRKKISFFLFC